MCVDAAAGFERYRACPRRRKKRARLGREVTAAQIEPGYAAAGAARTTGFSTIGRCSSAETMPSAIDPHHTGS